MVFETPVRSVVTQLVADGGCTNVLSLHRVGPYTEQVPQETTELTLYRMSVARKN